METSDSSLKYCTILLFRIYKWDKSYYYSFINTVAATCSETTMHPSFLFDWDKTGEDLKTFHKKILTIIEDSGYDYNSLNFQNKQEEQFFQSLPNNDDLILDGIYFLLLSDQKQKEFLMKFWSYSNYLYQTYCNEHAYAKQEHSLLADFRSLSKTQKEEVLDFISYLRFFKRT